MSITAEDFNSFAEFGRNRLHSGQAIQSLDDLVVEWESLQNRDEINKAIREGLADADAGRHRQATEVMSDLKRKHGLPASRFIGLS